MSPAIVSFILLSACGRVGFDPLGADAADGGPDAMVDSSAPADAGTADGGLRDAGAVDAAPADGGVLGPFGPAVAVAELNTAASEDDPTLTADRLEIVFASNRPMGMGSEDLWTASRASVSDPWDTPRPLTELNSSAGDSAPRISRDGLTLYFDSSRGGGAGGLDIWVTRRATRGDPWEPPTRVTELATGSDDAAAATDLSMRFMVFYSTRAGGAGRMDLYATSLDAAGTWSVPVATTELNTASEEAMPWLSADGLVVYFASDRPGGAGMRDLYRARRPTTSAPFGSPVAVAGLATAESDTDPWLSDDERVIFFSRGGALGDDLCEATR